MLCCYFLIYSDKLNDWGVRYLYMIFCVLVVFEILIVFIKY